MLHGSSEYFDERRRNMRRLSVMSLCVGLAMLAPVLVLRLTSLGSSVRDLDAMRFGFAGPPRYVELVQIDAQTADLSPLRDVGHVISRSGLRGDRGPRADPARHPGKVPAKMPGDNGESGEDLVARAVASRGNVPVMQSSELVIDKLVRPIYPDEARSRGVEGHVAVLARVDTLGHVVEAEIMSASGEPVLDTASRAAVMACRFRPFFKDGKVSEVYAVFRFAFRIY